MPVNNIYYQYFSNFYAHNEFSYWSVDISIPAQTVYASGELSNLQGEGPMFCGVAAYTKDTGQTVTPSQTHLSVVPAIFDSNVVQVSFLYGAGNGNGDCNLRILGFG